MNVRVPQPITRVAYSCSFSEEVRSELRMRVLLIGCERYSLNPSRGFSFVLIPLGCKGLGSNFSNFVEFSPFGLTLCVGRGYFELESTPPRDDESVFPECGPA